MPSRRIGDRIRLIRIRRGLSQRALAQRIGCPRSYISKLEHHRAIPTLRSCERVAAALEIEIWQLAPAAADVRYGWMRRIADDPFLCELAEYAPLIRKSDLLTLTNAARLMTLGRYAAPQWLTA